MEEAKLQRVLAVVKGMLAKGMAQDEVKQKLKALGMPDADVEDVLKRAAPPVEVVTPPPVEEEKPRPEEHTVELEAPPRPVPQPTAPSTAAAPGSLDIYALKDELDEIKEMLLEMKPMLAATQKLCNDMIKTNKMLLTKSVEQKK